MLKSPTFAVPILGLNTLVMFAVVKIAGQQFRVQEGQSLYVPHLQGKAGDQVEFNEVLFTDNDGNISVGSAVKAIVKAEIVSDLVKGDKVIAFKMKRRKGFRKKHGHRTHYTRIKVNSIA
jgi:large subunit ribosomal protein L21